MKPRSERKKPRKPVVAELDERITMATDLLLQGQSDGAIKRAIAEKFDLSPRSVERYLRRARTNLVRSTNKTSDELREINLAKYWEIVDDAETEQRDRIKALERIDKLLGLEIRLPKQIEVSGPDGAPIQQAVTVASIDLSSKLVEYASALRAAAIANVQEQSSMAALPSPTHNK